MDVSALPPPNHILSKPIWPERAYADWKYGRDCSRSRGLSLEAARAKWTLAFQGHRDRGQYARARSIQMDVGASNFWDQMPNHRPSLHFLHFCRRRPGLVNRWGGYARRGGRPHVRSSSDQMKPKSNPTWAIFGRIATFIYKTYTHLAKIATPLYTPFFFIL
jgi:hypothetical protein